MYVNKRRNSVTDSRPRLALKILAKNRAHPINWAIISRWENRENQQPGGAQVCESCQILMADKCGAYYDDDRDALESILPNIWPAD